MRSRGDVKRLWVGVLIALPSGAGVALSVLGGNTGEKKTGWFFIISLYSYLVGSLVGVAISGGV